MNHYPHHIGDFNNATRHLNRVERSVYRDLLDIYYDTEKPLSLDTDLLCRKIIAASEQEVTAVQQVLKEFFVLTDLGYENSRCEKDIDFYQNSIHNKSKAGKASAKARKARKAKALKDQQKSTGVQQPLNSSSTGVNNHNHNHNHNQITKSEKKNTFSEDDMKVSEYIFSLIKELDETHKTPNLDAWANDVRLMVKQDGRTYREICEVFKWANKDDFWKTNILSPSKLRKQFDALKLKAKPNETKDSGYGSKHDNSAVGRVNANIERELEQIRRDNCVEANDINVRPQMD